MKISKKAVTDASSKNGVGDDGGGGGGGDTVVMDSNVGILKWGILKY